jgi:hypothetical protein
MNRWMGMVVVAGLLAACEKKTEAPGPALTASQAQTRKPHSAEQPHAHAAPHGGWVESTPHGHLELVATREGGYRVYLLDDALSPRPVEGASGSVKVAKGGYPDVTLSPAGDHLAGQGPAHTDEHLAMVVTVVQGGKPESARFAAHLEANGHGDLVGELRQEPCPATPPAGLTTEQCAKQGGVYTLVVQGGSPVLLLVAQGQDAKALLGPKVGQRVHIEGPVEETAEPPRRVKVERVTMEHDHTPLRGGIVAMSGEMHLEVLSLHSGEVRVWVTDAFRQPVPLSGMKGTVEAGGQSLALTPEPGGQFLTAKLPASAQERETTVRLPMPGDPEYFITFLLTPKDAQGAASAPSKDGATQVQEVTITVAGSYQPSEVKLKKGVPARLRFIRKDTGGCAEQLIIPDFGVKQVLPGLTETVVEFTPDKVGSFPFTCGMRMMKGTLVVN